jgi:signal transduction histidine kinase
MAYKAIRKGEKKEAGGISSGRRKAPERRWRLVDDDHVRQPYQSEALAKLSHDIHSQLYIIIGYAELMLEEIPGKINDEQRHSLNDVLKSGKRLQILLDNIVGQPGSKSGKTVNNRVPRGVK